jgi:putative N-acetyltransferase (TIGR04045 family)
VTSQPTEVAAAASHPVVVRGGLDQRVRAQEVVCFEALAAEQVAMHYSIRRAVFVEEQAIFAASDVDEHDAQRDVVHVLAMRGEQPVGAVRLYPIDQEHGIWKGDRLAVLRPCRTYGVGAPLVRFAVAQAAARGGSQMIARVQLPNLRFFERLGWSKDGDSEEYLGRSHQTMSIALAEAAVAPSARHPRPRS